MSILGEKLALGERYSEAPRPGEPCPVEPGTVGWHCGTATEPCRWLGVLLNGLLLGAELEEVSSHDHGFEGAPCLDHVVLCERGLAFFRRLWARC